MKTNWLLPVGLVIQAVNKQEVKRTGKKIFLNIKVNAGIFYNKYHFNVSFYPRLKNVSMKAGWSVSVTHQSHKVSVKEFYKRSKKLPGIRGNCVSGASRDDRNT
ncbi:MAG: hypothetical protein PHY54_04650 [Methylococcales bacterium]|nr:hypothetical protein [Methylococcales bacterium]